MKRVVCIGVGVMLATASVAVAVADPAPRLVLADRDAELKLAIETALQPWHVEIVVNTKPVADTTAASARAETEHARFIVWRDRGELVVFDADDQSQQRRSVTAGTLDPVAAASVALTVKTILRLPPIEGAPIAPVGVARGPELVARIAAGGAFPSNTGTLGAIDAQLLVRPWPSIGLGLGVAIEAYGSESIDAAGFKGSWSEQRVMVIASERIGLPHDFAIEPWLGAGVIHSGLSGDEGPDARDESTWLAGVSAGAFAWWRWQRFEVGAEIAVDSAFGTPTYTKTGPGKAEVFEVPSFGVVAAISAGVSFGL